MIYIDDRVGSKEFLNKVDPSTLRRLKFGDFMFRGKGPDGFMDIGIERKTIHDFLQSMCTGRLSGYQIPGMIETYGFSYIILEGRWRSNPKTGILEVRQRDWEPIRFGRKFTGTEVYNMINTIEVTLKIPVIRTESTIQTAIWIKAAYKWWTGKAYHEHRSQMNFKRPHLGTVLSKPTLLKTVAACLPGIGIERADIVSKHFSTVEEMVAAGVSEWVKIEGIGKITAEKVVQALRDSK